MSSSPARRNHNDPDRDEASWAPLERAERLIDQGLDDVALGWVKVGAGLTTVKANGLWKAQYASFDEYCREKWGLDRTRAFRTARAYGLSARGVRIRNVEQADAVAGLPDDAARNEAIERAEKTTAGKVTGKALKAAAAEMTGAPTTEPREPAASASDSLEEWMDSAIQRFGLAAMNEALSLAHIPDDAYLRMWSDTTEDPG